MTRHLYLGNYLNMILSTISHKITHLLLSVIPLDRHQHIIHTPSAARLGCKSGIFLDFNGPRLVIYQVKMNHIKLIASHLWNKSLQLLVRHKDTARIHHQFSYMGTRLIFHHQLRDGITTYLRSITTKQLVKSHQAIEHTGCGLALDYHAFLLNFQGISLIVWKTCIQGKRHGKLCALLHALGVNILLFNSFL